MSIGLWSVRLRGSNVIKKKKERGKKKRRNMLTPELRRASCQSVPRARCTRQAVDWLHWAQLQEVSAEATGHPHAHTHTHALATDRQNRSDLLPDIMMTSLCQLLAACFLCGPVQKSGCFFAPPFINYSQVGDKFFLCDLFGWEKNC